MTLEEALGRLKALGSHKVRAQNARQGAGDNSPFAPIWINEMVRRQSAAG